MWLSWHIIMLCILFWGRISKKYHFKGLYYFPCINTQWRATARFDNTPVISPLQSKDLTTGLYHVYLVCNLLSYGELSIYVLLLWFGLSHRYNILDNTGWLIFIVLHFVKSFVWYIYFFSIQLLLRFFCLGPASRLPESHCHGWVRYIYTTKTTVLMLVWYRLVFTQYIYYRELFLFGARIASL